MNLRGATLFIAMAKEKNNLWWHKVIQIYDKEGNLLEIESYRESIKFIDTESGRVFEINKSNLDTFISLISDI